MSRDSITGERRRPGHLPATEDDRQTVRLPPSYCCRCSASTVAGLPYSISSMLTSSVQQSTLIHSGRDTPEPHPDIKSRRKVRRKRDSSSGLKAVPRSLAASRPFVSRLEKINNGSWSCELAGRYWDKAALSVDWLNPETVVNKAAFSKCRVIGKVYSDLFYDENNSPAGCGLRDQVVRQHA